MSLLPSDSAPRARVSSDRWFSNAAGSSSLRRPQPPSTRSHGINPRPVQRRSSLPRATGAPLLTALALLLLCLTLLVPARAQQILAPPENRAALQMRDILVDPQVAPQLDARNRLFARQDDPIGNLGGGSASAAPRSSSASAAAPSSSAPLAATTLATTPRFTPAATTAVPSSTGTGLVVASDTPTAQVPQPFDTSLGNNFTNPTCPQFIQSFLKDPTFTSCLPLSLLLMVSPRCAPAELRSQDSFNRH